MILPDYVFDRYFEGISAANPEYVMLNMTSLRQFVNENRHLPRVPSRSDLIRDGAVNIQGLTMLTLEKVEENTLYILDLEATAEKQQKMIESQMEENQQLKSELQSLREEIDQIKGMLGKGDVR